MGRPKDVKTFLLNVIRTSLGRYLAKWEATWSRGSHSGPPEYGQPDPLFSEGVLFSNVTFFESRGNTQVVRNFNVTVFESSATLSLSFKDKDVVFRNKLANNFLKSSSLNYLHIKLSSFTTLSEQRDSD